MAQPRIGIVGAGPGGLTAAIAARRLGLEVELFEQAPDFQRIGGGILIHSNGLRVLDALGLLEGFEPRVRFERKLFVTDASGKVLSTVDYRRLDVPQNRAGVVLRFELQEYLLEAARAAGIDVRFGMKCAGAVEEAAGVRLDFEGGEAARVDAVFAFDGINSRVRDGLGLPVRKRPIGEAYLRGVVARVSPDPTIREVWGSRGRRFGICPLPNDQVYFYCNAPLGRWRETRETGLEAWIESWASFNAEAVSILRDVPDWDRVNYSELSEISLDRWYAGRVFVAGDAAHAMTPNLGQGGNSAMVDALVLAQLVAREPLDRVGPRYEAVRKEFVTKVQAAARQVGEVAAWSGEVPRRLRDTLIGLFDRIDAVTRPSLLLGAGFNPREQEYFRPLPR
jgi:2-polyprenyl-6-methoxyphenol hydroxylase-like FAD-dependent oxidoreductase